MERDPPRLTLTSFTWMRSSCPEMTMSARSGRSSAHRLTSDQANLGMNTGMQTRGKHVATYETWPCFRYMRFSPDCAYSSAVVCSFTAQTS